MQANGFIELSYEISMTAPSGFYLQDVNSTPKAQPDPDRLYALFGLNMEMTMSKHLGALAQPGSPGEGLLVSFIGAFDRSKMLSRAASIGRDFAAGRRAAREFASFRSFNDHLLRDMGLRRELDGR